MKISLSAIVLLAMATFGPWSEARAQAPKEPAPIKQVDLASDTEWSLSIDDGAPRPIKVPAGGYNSDRQDKPWIQMDVAVHDGKQMPQVRQVKDHATYQRRIVIPKEAQGHSVLVEFGAVNHGAEVILVDGTTDRVVGSHVGPLMPFSIDLTAKVEPGKEYTLKVKTYPLWHYQNRVPVGFIYGEAWTGRKDGWASKFGFGITKYVRMAIYPKVRITNTFVRTSVLKRSFSCEVSLRNDTPEPKAVQLAGLFDSWNGKQWPYPELPGAKVTIPAQSEVTVTLGPVAWTLGEGSYWWPNKPFSENYQPMLHNLRLSLRSGETVLDQRTQRFGFVEWSEGPFYYLVNGVRINFIGDGTPESGMSEYDCYATSPAFLPATTPGTGCQETWKRYMRMGICANRLHQSTPTEAMLDAADETGFLLIPETAIRGCQGQVWDDELLPQSVRELARFCRNHPSVCRYSVLNEANLDWVGPLADALTLVDNTRPIIWEDSVLFRPARISGSAGAHAYSMMHYANHPKPAAMITGLGEYAWMGDQRFTMHDFAAKAMDARRYDNAYYAGWDWINYWPNFLEGMSAARHAWKQSYYGADRKDGVDGWNSAPIRWVQRCFHPYLVMDTAFAELNGAYRNEWPTRIPAYRPGEAVSRAVEVFNDGLTDAEIIVRWSARWDSPTGELIARGELSGPPIKAGFHAQRTLAFNAPPVPEKRQAFLVLESVRGKETLFRDDLVRIFVDPSVSTGSATFIKEDVKTLGNWPGKYGSAARQIIGQPEAGGAPPYVTWTDGKECVFAANPQESRALRLDATEPAKRFAAARFGKTMKFTLDVGPKPTKVSFYMVDWDLLSRTQDVLLLTEGNRLLDCRPVSSFGKGVWLSWTICGRVCVEINSTKDGQNAVISGIFFD